MQASLGHFAALTGDGVAGEQQTNQARRLLPRSAPPIANIWMNAIEAVALAVRGDLRALALLDRAEGHLPAANTTEPAWPWLFRFDEPKLAGYRAVAAARLGRHKIAAAALTIADQATSACAHARGKSM